MIKHFIDIKDFKKNELRKILLLANKIKKKPQKYSSTLENNCLGLIFEKQSMRTRLSFNIGMQKLGGKVIELNSSQIGFGSRESPEDMLKVMSQYLDILMIRNNNHKQLLNLASLNTIPVINGLSNFSHPCQILSDIFTIEECLGPIEGKTIAWLGDFNNVLISLIEAAEIFKFKLNVLVPKSLNLIQRKKLNTKNLCYTFFYNDTSMGVENVDCVMTDVWISMGEKNKIKKKQLLKKFQVNERIMNKTKKNAIFMHCLPAHRNEEVTDQVIDSDKSVVWQQAKNRMFVQQSILINLINNDK